MNAPVHPDIELLYQRYTQLADSYNAGHINYDEAVRTLENLVVIDGAGAHWAMNLHGQLTMGYPGEDPQVADPISFTPPQIPERGGWDGGPLVAPPIGGSSFPAPVAPSGFDHGYDQGQQQFDPFAAMPSQPQHPDTNGTLYLPEGFGEEEPQERSKAKRAPKEKKAPKVKLDKPPAPKKGATRAKTPKAPKAPRANPVASLGDTVLDGLAGLKGAVSSGRGRTVAIAVICAGVLAFAYVGSQDKDTSAGIPSSPSVSQGAGKAPSLPIDQPAATTPNGDEVNGLLAALVSGDPAAASKVVVDPKDEGTTNRAVGELYGYKNLGFNISAGPAAVEGDGAAQTWSLVSGDATLAAAKVHLVRGGDGWKISTWPTFAR